MYYEQNSLFCHSRSLLLTWYLWTKSWRTSHIHRTLKSNWLNVLFMNLKSQSHSCFPHILLGSDYFRRKQNCYMYSWLWMHLVGKYVDTKRTIGFVQQQYRIWHCLYWFNSDCNLCFCNWLQDCADTRGSNQCERCQSEQLPRGSHGQDHLCQCQQGNAAWKASSLFTYDTVSLFITITCCYM